MKRFLLTLSIGALAVFTAQWQTSGAVLQSPDGSPSHRFEELADGVYFATGTGVMTVMSNSLVVINDDHVMLVDTSVTPAAARGLVQGIEALTDKPIKYVFNTHYHFDHAHGNQIFGDDVEIIGHDYVRTMLSSNVLIQRTNRTFSAAIPGQLDALRERIAGETDASARAELEAQLRIQEAHWEALKETEPTPPTVTYSDSLTLVKGGREVQLHHPGPGHTGGDTLVFLPEERIVFTGDFFVGSPDNHSMPYMGDGYVEEWPDSLHNLKGLQFDVMVPGHGRPFQDRAQIDHLQAYLRDLNAQVTALYAEGVSVEDAVAQIDLSSHEDHYGARARNVDPRAVVRMYERLQVKMPY